MKIKAIVKPYHITDHSGENLWIYRNGHLTESINIDRTFFAVEWCERHKMVKTEEIIAVNGERFEIFKRSNELICAIPVAAA